MSEGFLKMINHVAILDRQIRKGKALGSQGTNCKSSYILFLHLLHQHPNGMLFSELCEQSSQDAGLASRVLKEMRQENLVIKNEESGKYKALYTLTEQGKELAHLADERIRIAQRAAVQGIDPKDLQTFYQVAAQLAANIETLPEHWRKFENEH